MLINNKNVKLKLEKKKVLAHYNHWQRQEFQNTKTPDTSLWRARALGNRNSTRFIYVYNFTLTLVKQSIVEKNT